MPEVTVYVGREDLDDHPPNPLTTLSVSELPRSGDMLLVGGDYYRVSHITYCVGDGDSPDHCVCVTRNPIRAEKWPIRQNPPDHASDGG